MEVHPASQNPFEGKKLRHEKKGMNISLLVLKMGMRNSQSLSLPSTKYYVMLSIYVISR